MTVRCVIVNTFCALMFAISLCPVCGGQSAAFRPRPRPHPIQTVVASGTAMPSPGNWSQLGKLISGQGFFGENFGSSVGISGDTVVVGAYPTYSNTRSAYVYLKTAHGWANTLPVAALSLRSQTNGFFTPLAIDGDTVVVGVPASNYGYPSYACVYVRPSGGWANMKPTAVLTPSDTMDGYFGISVSISGNTIVVGDSGFHSGPGAGYVYVKPTGGWSDMTETAKLTASDGGLNDLLGQSASISGGTVALGAPQYSFGYGKAYVFVEPGSGWTSMTQTAELTTDGTYINAGESIAGNGTVILAGATSGGAGGAYIFQKPSSGWSNMPATAKLSPGDGAQDSYFGTAVGLSGNIAIVGAERRSIGVMQVEGGIYVFQEPNGGWIDQSSTTVLTGSDARYYSFFGSSVAMDGKVVVGGSPNFFSAGEAFVFGLP
jgi:hypothetical protein